MYSADIKDIFHDITSFKKSILDITEHIDLVNIKENTTLVYLNNELTLYQDSINRDEFILIVSVPNDKVLLPFNYIDKIVYLAATDVSITPAHDYFSNFADFYESSKVINEHNEQYSLRELLKDEYLVVIGFKLNILSDSIYAQTNETLEMICKVEQDLTLDMKKLTFSPNEQYLFGFCFIKDKSGISHEINRRQNKFIDDYALSKKFPDDVDIKNPRGETIHNNNKDRHDRGGRLINHSEMSNPSSITSKTKNVGSSYDPEFTDKEKIVKKLHIGDHKIKLNPNLLNKNFVCYDETIKSGILSFNPVNNEANIAPQRTSKYSSQFCGSQMFNTTDRRTSESEIYSAATIKEDDLGLCIDDLDEGDLEIDRENVITFLHTSNYYTKIFGYQSCLLTLITSQTDNLKTILSCIGSRSNAKRFDCSFGCIPGDRDNQNFPSRFIEDGRGTNLDLSNKEMKCKNEILNLAKYIIISVDLN